MGAPHASQEIMPRNGAGSHEKPPKRCGKPPRQGYKPRPRCDAWHFMPDEAPPAAPGHYSQTIRWTRPGRVIELEQRDKRNGNGWKKFSNAMRYVHLVLVVLFMLGVIAQAHSAGRFIFGVVGDNDAHVALGWPLAHMLAPLMMLASFFTRGGKGIYIGSIVAFVIAAAMPFVALANEEGASEVEALHPVMAVLLFGVLLWLFLREMKLVSKKAS